MSTGFSLRTIADAWKSMRLEACVAAVLILALLGTWTMSREVELYVEEGGVRAVRAEANGLVRLMAEQWQQTVQQVEFLHYLARQATTIPTETGQEVWRAPADLQKAIALSPDGIKQVGAIDPRGRMLWTTDTRAPGRTLSIIDLSDREHFRAIAIDGRERFVGRPVRGRVTGRWTIQFAAAHRDESGRLEAVTVVSVDMAGTRALAEKAGLLRRGVVMLIRDDGVILGRSIDQEDALRKYVEPQLLRDVLANGQAEMLTDGPIDAVPRFYSLRRVPGSDLIVAVGLNESEAMAPTNAAVDQIHRWAFALGLALIAMALVVNAVFRRSRSLSLERRRSHELYQRQALLREIAESASDIIVILDEQLRPLFINPAVKQVLGIRPDEIQTFRFADHMLPEDLDRVRAELQALKERTGSWRGTYRVRHADGSIRWLESEVVSVTDTEAPDGPRFVAISRDITHRMEDEAALRTVKAELNALIRMGPGSFYRMSISAEGRDSRWFPAGFCLLGLTPGDAEAAERFSQRVYPADRPVLSEAIERCASAGDATAEYRLFGPQQELRWVRDRMRLVAGSLEENVVFGYITEITQEREDMSRLRQAERLATLGEVATGIAHEMNQPLAAIAMAAENGLRLLRQEPPVDQIMAKLNRIAEHAHRLGHFTDAVCLFGRADANAPWDASFDEVLSNVRVLVKPRLLAAGAWLNVDVQPHLPRMKVSSVTLEQALMNLIANSCDAYTSVQPGRRDPVIRITARAEGDQVRITVADQAGGIPNEIIDRVFNPFVTTKDPGKGTGLGLSITYARITEMGGRIAVRNRDGGATFDILLPVLADFRNLEAVQ